MDLYQKISILGPSAKYDTCGPQDFGDTTNIPGVYHAKVGGNHVCRLFKVLQTNKCLNNCRYCAFRRDRACPRVSATSDQMALAFDSAHRRRLVDGLFLSSGITNSADTTMTHMLDTLDIVRHKYKYKGYVHLKIMPGASDAVIRQSFKLANRISINIESPTQTDLTHLSPDKNLKNGFFDTLFRIRKAVNQAKYYKLKTPSLTTQFVVGAGQEKDSDIIHTTHLLYQQFGLKRVFYSPFRPIPQTPLADKPATPITRAHRLYQADFLMRFYRFSPQDLYVDSSGRLDFNIDPKMLWAQKNPHFYPINLNKADYWKLLKIPGIGPTSAKKIIRQRQHSRLFSFSQLSGLRLQISKISQFSCF